MIELSHAEQEAKYASLAAASLWQGPNVPACAIISASTDDAGEYSNALFTEILEDDLKLGFWSYKHLKGCWQGHEEASFLVLLSSDIHLQEIQIASLLRLAHVYAQDAILVLDRYRAATLHFPGGEDPQAIGKFRPVDATYALAQDGWTYDQDAGQYYCIV